MDKNKIIEVKIPYEEWIKSPFPQMNSLKLDTTTRYIVTNCPPEYVGYLKNVGVDVEIPDPERLTITFYPKVKLNGTEIESKIKYVNYNSGNKIIIIPKGIGITEDIFDWDGKVKVVRIFSSNEFMTAKYIKIGNEKLNCVIGFTQPSKVQDFIFNCEFKIGDKFEMDADFEIKKVELFLES